MREIGRDVGIEIFSVDVAICASNRQLSLKPFRATVIPRSSYLPFSRHVSPRPVAGSRALSPSTTCRATADVYAETGVQFARGACERGMHHMCVRVSRPGERAESGSFTSFARALTFMHCATPRIAGGILDARVEHGGNSSRVFKRR